MKKYLFGLVCLMCAITSVSCDRDSDPDPVELSVSISEILFDANSGNKKSVKIDSNYEWVLSNVSETPYWLNVIKESESMMSITTNEFNNSMKSRSTDLIISATNGVDTKQETITVTQEAGLESVQLSVNLSEVALSKDKGSKQSVVIKTNYDWILKGAPQWVNVSASNGKGDSTITFETNEFNNSMDPRSAEVSIIASNGEESKSTNLYVVQEAGLDAVELSVNLNEISLSENKGSKQMVTIKSNYEWTLSGVPEWLNVSAYSGNGESSIELETNEFNNSTTSRSAELKIEASNGVKTARTSITVYQKAGLVANCSVNPNKIVTLSDGIAFDYLYGDNVAYFLRYYILKSELGRYTDDELIKRINDYGERLTPNDNILSSVSSLSANTEYVILTVAYDKNGKRGELVKTGVRTKNDKNQAMAFISDEVKYDSNYWYFDTTIGGYCSSYYLWIMNGSSASDTMIGSSDVVIAWYMSNLISEYPDDFSPIIQSASWTVRRTSADRYLQIITWGCDKNNNLAGCIDNFYGYITYSSQKTITKELKEVPIQSKMSTVSKQALQQAFKGVKIIKVNNLQ